MHPYRKAVNATGALRSGLLTAHKSLVAAKEHHPLSIGAGCDRAAGSTFGGDRLLSKYHTTCTQDVESVGHVLSEVRQRKRWDVALIVHANGEGAVGWARAIQLASRKATAAMVIERRRFMEAPRYQTIHQSGVEGSDQYVGRQGESQSDHAECAAQNPVGSERARRLPRACRHLHQRSRQWC